MAPPLGTGAPEALPTPGYHIDLVQTTTVAEFMSTVALLCPEATVLLQSSLTTGS